MLEIPFNISAGDSAQFEYTFYPSDTLNYTDTLIIKSSDPDEAVIRLALVGKGLNSAPQVVSNFLDLTLEEDFVSFNYRALNDVFSDPNNEPMQFELSNNTNIVLAKIISGDTLQLTAAADAFGIDTIIVKAVDNYSAFAEDTFIVNIAPVNDAPQIFAIPDTAIKINEIYKYTVKGSDIDSDTLTFSDNTPLFEINSDSGIIRFTPTIEDNGLHQIIITVSDNEIAVQDTFMLAINSNDIQPAANLTSDGGNQFIDLQWENPANLLYSGTQIRIDRDKMISDPDSGTLVLDTVLTNSGSIHYRISDLDIAQEYHYAIFNYHTDGTNHDFSLPANGMDTTFAPKVWTNVERKHFQLTTNDTISAALTVKNIGKGTLIYNFTYNADTLQQKWFSLDRSIFTVLPGDSQLVNYAIMCSKEVPEDTVAIEVSLNTNEPSWQDTSITISLFPIYDHFAPQLSWQSAPIQMVNEAAVLFQYSADDTSGKPIGDETDNLRVNYELISLSDSQIIAQESGISVADVELYPLADDDYLFKMRVYDTENNSTYFEHSFTVQASVKSVIPNHWYLAAFPRPADVDWMAILSDSSKAVFRWNHSKNDYLQYSKSKMNAGFGFWFYPTESSIIDLTSIPVDTLENSVTVQLERGWNQLGAPAGYSLKWADAVLKSGTTSLSLETAALQGLVEPAVYWQIISSAVSGYEWTTIDSAIAKPFRGYWLYSNVEGELSFPVKPYYFYREEFDASSNRLSLSKNSNENWRLNLSLSTKGYSDSKNIIGINSEKSLSKIFEPPHFGEYSRLFFKDDGQNSALTQSIKEPFKAMDDVKDWNMFIETSRPNQLQKISWNLPKNDNIYFYLVDNKREEIIDMRKSQIYEFKSNSRQYSFKVYATLDESFKPKIIPQEFKLLQNYPNPFNPSTTIKFGITESGAKSKTVLKIFNVLGQEIVTLINKRIDSGYHKIVWNGANRSGSKVSSGIYFYYLLNGKSRLVKKMVLIK
jgi:hypothetical protein